MHIQNKILSKRLRARKILIFSNFVLTRFFLLSLRSQKNVGTEGKGGKQTREEKM